ncbi:hypothetical protein BaRGS_00038470 [Batillaria attramentaria]|uniref:xanthine dehydrogenase n=1 Tax=Batillaria attramentaria TaxID=370345 RepID=A0ABD0J5N3_9CAEN
MAGDELVFFVNGRKVEVKNPDPEMTLLQYLRRNLQLTGTKSGCGEGGCGACTVMVSRYRPEDDVIQHFSVNACLAPVCSMHGLAVTTVEGIGSLRTQLHPAQERLASAHGSQCGFCTPGFVMSMYTLLRNHPTPTPQQLEKAFDGNLCRCTGYRPIIEGYTPFTKGCCGMGEECCQNRSASSQLNGEIPPPSTQLYDPTQEPIFPPYLKSRGKELQNQPLLFSSERVTWYRPTSLTELLDLKKKHPDCKFIIGNTEIGIETKFKKQLYPVLVSATNVPELLVVDHTSSGIRFGSSVTLADMETVLKKAVGELPESKTKVFAAIIEMLQWFGGQQIRNVAALGGNIMTASPISDLNPLLMACGAQLQLASTDGKCREVTMDDKFLLGYRKTAVKPTENEYFYGYKQATRKEDDVSIVNAGIRVVLDEGAKVTDAALAFGGMADVTVMATKTRDGLVGHLLCEDLPLEAGAVGGMVQYRRTLTLSFFFKFYLAVLQKLQQQNKAQDVPLARSYVSATQPMERSLPRGSQVYEAVCEDQSPDDALHRPLVHQSAYRQASGEAVYLDDIPVAEGELFMGLVQSTEAHARLVKVDPSPALAMPGVVDFVSHLDVPGKNIWSGDMEAFASKEVFNQGQLIGAVVAESQTIAQRAAQAVVVEYEKLESIVTIKEAIAKKSFFPLRHEIKRGDLAAGFQASEHIVEGEVHIEAQEHFYIETNAALVRPGEDGEMEVIATTQELAGIQSGISSILGVPQHKIVVRTKRLGGGFGGKQIPNATVTLPVAVAANKVKRAVRCVLDRDEDMMMTGTRNPTLARYKVGFRSDGRIQALEVDFYINCGVSTVRSGGKSLSPSVSSYDSGDSPQVMDKELFSSDNSYNVPNVRVTGHMCKTNITNTCACRGAGCPEGMMVAETYVQHVASYLKLAPEKVREINFYKEGDTTHYNQKLELVNLKRCWDECMERSQFQQRRKQVDLYNSENRWKKRGLAVIPMKCGVSFTYLPMNQGGALVHIYTDGSVLVTHGGVEMGQGLHTKMIQVASRVLGLPASRINTLETSTETVPNSSVSAASMSSDLYGEAVKNACETLRDRLDNFRKTQGKSDLSWEELVNSAYSNRVSLSATGFWIVPDIGYDFHTGTGKPFVYFTYGAACSEVEIDCLTGDHKVLSTDLVVDVGKSLNPTIDIGQVEGAFMMGYGLMLLEQYKVRPDGTLLTRGPGTYKLPSLGNIPTTFNVSLLRHSNNPRAVFSSKGMGEPALFLACSVLHAVQDAIDSARRDAGLEPQLFLDTPATPDRIRMACGDMFTKQIEKASKAAGPTDRPWFVEL